MNKNYCAVFHGLIGTEQYFETRMAALGVSPDNVMKLLNSAPVILKSGLSAEEAKRYAHAVQEAGGKVTLQEQGDSIEPSRENPSISIPTFGDFTMCTECGMKQPRGKTCERCGHTFTKKEVREDVPGH